MGSDPNSTQRMSGPRSISPGDSHGICAPPGWEYTQALPRHTSRSLTFTADFRSARCGSAALHAAAARNVEIGAGRKAAMHHTINEHPHPAPTTEHDRIDESAPLSGVGLSRLPAPPRCLVMGIVNVTPDSFSDGGLCAAADSAITRGLALAADGADIVDIGGESTRPHAQRVPVAEELRRVIPVVRELSGAGVLVSVDTMRAAVAAAAVEAGAAVVNDVSGGLADPNMAATVADLDVPYIAMHWRGHSTTMADLAVYDDVVTEVVAELADRLDALVSAGIREDRIVLDPGLGFAKTGAHNWALLAHLDRILELGRPVLVGASRKSFLGALMTDVEDTTPPPADRDDLTCAVSTLAAAAGAYCVRVHDVKSTRRGVAVAAAWESAS